MSISLDSIYNPVNDFFYKKFKNKENAPIVFRLQQFGSVIETDDFNELNDPKEEFSDFVNRIPILDENEINVTFSTNNIDDTYSHALSSLPYVPDSFNENEKESIEQIFIRTKAKAIKSWEVAERVRSGGIADAYRLSSASPTNWHNNESNWEKQEFEVKEVASTAKANKNKADYQILKIRMTDTELSNLIPNLNKPKPLMPVDLSKKAFKMTQLANFKKSKTTTASSRGKPIIKQKPNVKMNPVFMSRALKPVPLKVSGRHKKPISNQAKHLKKRNHKKKTAIGGKFSQAFHSLKFNHKNLVKDYIKNESPTKPVNTNKVSISFEFCVIDIRRSWLSEGLCSINKFWYIPGMGKGDLNDPLIGAFSHLPIALVAVKDLKITANWNINDKKELAKVTSFGPFDINEHNLNEKGSLSHSGIQVIGWMLQKMPELPPNEKV